MKIHSACIYAMQIPFRQTFKHNLSERKVSNSVIVKLTTDKGVSGFGEGVPRPFLTRETQDTSIQYIQEQLLPLCIGIELDKINISSALQFIHTHLPDPISNRGAVWNASTCAVELALIDCLLQSHEMSLAQLLHAKRNTLRYAGVISAGSSESIRALLVRCKKLELTDIKLKITCLSDWRFVALARELMGDSVSIRLDANAAFDLKTALDCIHLTEPFGIQCLEQPIAQGHIKELAQLRRLSSIPIMADESIVTCQDARALIRHQAVDYMNLRLSKCGGIYNSIRIAKLARSAGIGIQLGCQVGETAILSAAGRHLAAYLDPCFTEGSYSTELLVQDISLEPVSFGRNGIASLLTKPGLGIEIQEDVLNRYAQRIEL